MIISELDNYSIADSIQLQKELKECDDSQIKLMEKWRTEPLDIPCFWTV